MAGPSCKTQKKFIVRQEALLDMATKRAILAYVLAAAGAEPEGAAEAAGAGPETGGGRPTGAGAVPGVTDSPAGVVLDLDLLGRKDPNVVFHIYNVVQARVRALSVPAGAPGSAPSPGRGAGPRPAGAT